MKMNKDDERRYDALDRLYAESLRPLETRLARRAAEAGTLTAAQAEECFAEVLSIARRELIYWGWELRLARLRGARHARLGDRPAEFKAAFELVSYFPGEPVPPEVKAVLTDGMTKPIGTPARVHAN